MPAERIYRNDVYAAQTEAVVKEITDDPNGPRVILDRTVFCPEGGGQPSDTGMMNGLPVTYAFEKDGEVIHCLDVSGEEARQAGITAGGNVRVSIDWGRRFEHMQRHAGEHLLSGMFHLLYGGENKGFHMGEDHITVDILLPKGPGAPGSVTMDMAMACEEKANEIIWRDIPITVSYFDDPAQAARMPLRKDLTESIVEGAAAPGGTLSVVTIGDPADPADCVAC